MVPQHWHQMVNSRDVEQVDLSRIFLSLSLLYFLVSLLLYIFLYYSFLSIIVKSLKSYLPCRFFSSETVFACFELHSSVVALMLIKHFLMVMFISICGSIASLLNVVPFLSNLFSPSLLACPILYISLLEGLIPQFFL